MTVILHHDRDLTTDAFQQKLTPLLNDVPDVRFFNQSGFGSAGISVVLAGEDGPALERAQQQMLREMRTVKSISNRSEEHTSELQSLMRISSAVYCLKKKKEQTKTDYNNRT